MPSSTHVQIRVDPIGVFDATAAASGPIVVVEPLYGSVGASAALDAGWDSVELAGELDDQPPIPLVSFEQPPPVDRRDGGRCRVRCRDVLLALEAVGVNVDSQALLPALPAPLPPLLLACAANARPFAATLAGHLDPNWSRVTFVPAPVSHGAGEAEDEPIALDAWWACGMLVRVLLDELDGRDVQLADSAGIAVTLAQGAEPADVQLSAGARARRHSRRGGHADDLRVAAAVDSMGSVPVVTCEGASWVARAWRPTRGADPRVDRT